MQIVMQGLVRKLVRESREGVHANYATFLVTRSAAFYLQLRHVAITNRFSQENMKANPCAL